MKIHMDNEEIEVKSWEVKFNPNPIDRELSGELNKWIEYSPLPIGLGCVLTVEMNDSESIQKVYTVAKGVRPFFVVVFKEYPDLYMKCSRHFYEEAERLELSPEGKSVPKYLKFHTYGVLSENYNRESIPPYILNLIYGD